MALIIWTIPFVIALVAGLTIGGESAITPSGGITPSLLMLGLVVFAGWRSFTITRANVMFRSSTWGLWLIVVMAILQVAAVITGAVLVLFHVEAFAPTVCLTYLATFFLFFLTLPPMWWDKTMMEETRIAKELLGAAKN